MAEQVLQRFPPGVADKLRSYVYRLIDPRNGETFYVGKGIGDRVFAHAKADIQGDDLGEKLGRIREIRLAGFEVSHVIHRHGMDNRTASEVEAALIDAYSGLTNETLGSGSDVGAAHALEIVRRYKAEIAEFVHRVLLINVNRSAATTSLYEATRQSWRLNPTRAARAEVILANRHGIILEAFVGDNWFEVEAGSAQRKFTRYGFTGRLAPEPIRRMYVQKQVPPSFRKRGAVGPIKYNYL